MDAASAQLEESDSSSRRSETSSPASGGPGTGVFIPACILDGSALCDPVMAAKFPCRRQRRGSAPAQHCPQPVDPRQQRNDSSPSSHSDTTAAPANNSSHGRAHGGRNSSRHQGASSHSTSAKNPFASTPKNIRQQQLLCNLMAAADCFTDAGAAPAGPSRTASLDYGAMPPTIPGSMPAAGRACMDRPSMDMSSVPGVTSRTSLESYGWGYTNRGRNSCEVNRPSMDAASSSMRSSMDRASMDRASCWSGRPSVDSTFSAYGPAPPSPQLLAQQQQHQQAATAATAAAAAAVVARASYEAALPPTPAGNTLSRMGMWQAGRASCELPGLSPALVNSAFSRYSMDSAADPQVAAAAAAAVSAMQFEQQRGMNLMRFDSSNMSNVSSSSMDSAPSASPGRSDLAAAMAARRTQAAQLQQMIDSTAGASGGNMNATVAALAALTAQGIPPETAALLLMQAQNAADACANGQGMAPEAILFQQQLQQIMQANEMAAAASNAAAQAAAASQIYAAAAAATQQSEQRRAGNGRWRDLGYDSNAELYQGQGSSLPGPMDAANLQQQLELLQRMQL